MTWKLELDSVPRIDKMIPRRLDSAIFCTERFSESEPRFGVMRGVWRTAAGYCENNGDHMKAVMVEYDPTAVSYGQLLDIFLGRHPSAEHGDLEQEPASERSRVSCVLVKNEFERRLAKAAAARYALTSSWECVRVEVYRPFHQAEPRLQKYFLRSLPQLMDELRRMYPDEEHLIRSTLATRLNGILGQRAFHENTPRPDDFELYDLSERSVAILKTVLS